MVERPLVVDASVTLAWCIPDEASPQTEFVRTSVVARGAVEPVHWRMELEHTLHVARRQRRVDASGVAWFIQFIRDQMIEVEHRPLATTFGDLLPLARQLSLSVYDAAYVELASRRGLPLATLDANMRRAAQQAGVDLFDVA